MNNLEYFQRQEEKIGNEWLSANAKPHMIYKNHNLMNNYFNANQAGDEKMKADILTSEIAKIIVEKPQTVVSLLNQHAGFKIQGIPRRRRLVKYVTIGLNTNKKFAEAILKEIIAGGGSSSFSEDGTPAKPSTDIGGLMGGASDLLNSIGDLFAGKKKRRAKTAQAKAEAEKAKAEAEKALADKTKALAGEKKPNIALYIGIGLGIAAIAGTIIYVARRK